ncbi:MAG: beta-N-acetylhexosaminidase [Reyranellaceae bacterium]
MKAAIFGCAGPELGAAERDFFRQHDPLGFILFARNCDSPEQISRLVADLRASVGRDDAPVLIDQEGGRVQRLKPPRWRQAPPAARFGELFRRDPALGREAVEFNMRLIAADLIALGIDVDCVPCLDVPVPGAHDVIGDRAFALQAEIVADLGRIAANTMLDMGVMPVIKHIPGHGRAGVDSHHALPRVDTSAIELAHTDFLPFKSLSDMPWGMTAHVLYTAIDAQRPATTSPVVIERIVRGMIGFQGLLLSDDLSMQALGGTLADRAKAALAAGCDIALHCNGKLDEMAQVADTTPPMTPAALDRLARGRQRLNKRKPPTEAETAAWRKRLDRLMGSPSV